MLIYSVKDEDQNPSLWTKEALISIREMESDVRDITEYKNSCLLNQVTAGTV